MQQDMAYHTSHVHVTPRATSTTAFEDVILEPWTTSDFTSAEAKGFLSFVTEYNPMDDMMGDVPSDACGDLRRATSTEFRQFLIDAQLATNDESAPPIQYQSGPSFQHQSPQHLAPVTRV